MSSLETRSDARPPFPMAFTAVNSVTAQPKMSSAVLSTDERGQLGIRFDADTAWPTLGNLEEFTLEGGQEYQAAWLLSSVPAWPEHVESSRMTLLTVDLVLPNEQAWHPWLTVPGTESEVSVVLAEDWNPIVDFAFPQAVTSEGRPEVAQVTALRLDDDQLRRAVDSTLRLISASLPSVEGISVSLVEDPEESGLRFVTFDVTCSASLDRVLSADEGLQETLFDVVPPHARSRFAFRYRLGRG